jgi:hypothetical protein
MVPVSIVVIDLDGTVADARHRLHLIAGAPGREEWIRFFDAAADDPPLAEGVRTAQRLAATNDVVWLTGRPERIRALTETWLAGHGLPAGRLLMVPEGDHRPAREFKIDLMRKLAVDHDITMIVDDDPRVIALAEAEKLPTLHAQWVPWQPHGESDGGHRKPGADEGERT